MEKYEYKITMNDFVGLNDVIMYVRGDSMMNVLEAAEDIIDSSYDIIKVEKTRGKFEEVMKREVPVTGDIDEPIKEKPKKKKNTYCVKFRYESGKENDVTCSAENIDKACACIMEQLDDGVEIISIEETNEEIEEGIEEKNYYVDTESERAGFETFIVAAPDFPTAVHKAYEAVTDDARIFAIGEHNP